MKNILLIFLLLLKYLNVLQALHVSDAYQDKNENKNQFKCAHDQLEIPLIERNEEQQREFEAQKSRRRKLGVQNPEPMRITFDYSNLDSLSGSKAPLVPFFKQQFKVAKKFFEDNLKIDRVSGNNIFTAPFDYCLEEAAVPEADKSIGIADSDLHVYFATEFDSQSNYLSKSGSCYYYAQSRPTFGLIKYNLYYFDENYLKNDAFEDGIEIFIHQLAHILGFNKNLIRQFVNPATGNSYYADGLYPYITQTIRGVSTKIITTPKVVQTAREHYGCDSLIGLQLENNGNPDTQSFHWEQTIVFNDFMVSSHNQEKILYTKFTFALLEDSGWYLPDYTNLDTSLWGYQKGCAFFEGSCDTQNNEFVDSSVKHACNHNQSGYGPPHASIYTQEGGGSEQCYYAWIYNNRYCVNSTQYIGEYPPSYYWGYYFGENSRCAYSNIIATGEGYTWESDNGFIKCHEFFCDSSNNVFVIFDQEKYACVEGGICYVEQKGSNSRFSGYVEAPKDFEYFCMFVNECPNNCSQNGYCMKGKCHCLSGYVGNDCGTYQQDETEDEQDDTEDKQDDTEDETKNDTYTEYQSCPPGHYLDQNNTCQYCSYWMNNCSDCTDQNFSIKCLLSGSSGKINQNAIMLAIFLMLILIF